MAPRLPPHLAAASGVVGVIQAGKQVPVPGLRSCPLCKVPGQPEPPLAEVVLQPEAAADRHELLASVVTAADGSHGPPVDPGQVSLLLLGQSSTPDWTAVLQMTETLSLPV